MPSQPLTPRHFLAVVLTAAAATAIVTATLALGATLGGTERDASRLALIIRMGVSAVVAVVLLIQERRREHPSIREAFTSGLELAVLCVAMIVLPSGSLPAIDLWLRGAAILVGLPGLEVLMHLLVRGGSAASTTRSVIE